MVKSTKIDTSDILSTDTKNKAEEIGSEYDFYDADQAIKPTVTQKQKDAAYATVLNRFRYVFEVEGKSNDAVLGEIKQKIDSAAIEYSESFDLEKQYESFFNFIIKPLEILAEETGIAGEDISTSFEEDPETAQWATGVSTDNYSAENTEQIKADAKHQEIIEKYHEAYNESAEQILFLYKAEDANAVLDEHERLINEETEGLSILTQLEIYNNETGEFHADRHAKVKEKFEVTKGALKELQSKSDKKSSDEELEQFTASVLAVSNAAGINIIDDEGKDPFDIEILLQNLSNLSLEDREAAQAFTSELFTKFASEKDAEKVNYVFEVAEALTRGTKLDERTEGEVVDLVEGKTGRSILKGGKKYDTNIYIPDDLSDHLSKDNLFDKMTKAAKDSLQSATDETRKEIAKSLDNLAEDKGKLSSTLISFISNGINVDTNDINSRYLKNLGKKDGDKLYAAVELKIPRRMGVGSKKTDVNLSYQQIELIASGKQTSVKYGNKEIELKKGDIKNIKDLYKEFSKGKNLDKISYDSNGHSPAFLELYNPDGSKEFHAVTAEFGAKMLEDDGYGNTPFDRHLQSIDLDESLSEAQKKKAKRVARNAVANAIHNSKSYYPFISTGVGKNEKLEQEIEDAFKDEEGNLNKDKLKDFQDQREKLTKQYVDGKISEDELKAKLAGELKKHGVDLDDAGRFTLAEAVAKDVKFAIAKKTGDFAERFGKKAATKLAAKVGTRMAVFGIAQAVPVIGQIVGIVAAVGLSANDIWSHYRENNELWNAVLKGGLQEPSTYLILGALLSEGISRGYVGYGVQEATGKRVAHHTANAMIAAGLLKEGSDAYQRFKEATGKIDEKDIGSFSPPNVGERVKDKAREIV